MTVFIQRPKPLILYVNEVQIPYVYSAGKKHNTFPLLIWRSWKHTSIHIGLLVIVSKSQVGCITLLVGLRHPIISVCPTAYLGGCRRSDAAFCH